MTVKSFDPDSDPSTPPPSLSLSEVASEFGDPVKDPGAASNTGHSMSEFYKDGDYVPASMPAGVEVENVYQPETLRVRGLHPPDVDLYEDGEGRGVTFTETPSLQGDPFYIRLPSNTGGTGIVRYVWGTNVEFDVANSSFVSILFPVVYEGYEYKRSIINSTVYTYTESNGVEYQYVQIARRPVAVAGSETRDINDNVPRSGPIKFSDLYGAQKVINRTITVPALETNFLQSERGIEPDGAQGAIFGSGLSIGSNITSVVWPTGFTPNAVLKRVTFDIGFDARITVTSTGGNVPFVVIGSKIVSNGNFLRLDIRYPGWRIIGPSGGAVMSSYNAGESIGTSPTVTYLGVDYNVDPGADTSVAIQGADENTLPFIPTQVVDNLTERGTYYLEFTAQVRNYSLTNASNPALVNAGIYWKTPAFDIKIETT